MSSPIETLEATIAAHLPAVREASDEIRRAYAGAFAQLYSRLVRFAKPRVGGDQLAAEEVAQDTLVRGWQSLGSFQGGNLLAWLFSIARNCCAQHGRDLGKTKPLPGTPLPAPEAPTDEVAQEIVALLETFRQRLEAFAAEVEAVSAVLPPAPAGQGRPRQEQILPGLVRNLRNAVSRALGFLNESLSEASPREERP